MEFLRELPDTELDAVSGGCHHGRIHAKHRSLLFQLVDPLARCPTSSVGAVNGAAA